MHEAARFPTLMESGVRKLKLDRSFPADLPVVCGVWDGRPALYTKPTLLEA